MNSSKLFKRFATLGIGIMLGTLSLAIALQGVTAKEAPPAPMQVVEHSLLPAAPLAATSAITLDGVASPGEWDGWHLITDTPTLDVIFTLGYTACGGVAVGGTHPNQPPCYACSGYDLRGLWGQYQPGATDYWYFRMDVDGTPGDADSITGTVGALGVGTDGDDGGYITNSNVDHDGVSSTSGELYMLRFGPAAGSVADEAQLENDLGTGALFTLSAASDVTGQAIYSDTFNPGIIEWRIDKASMFTGGAFQPELWMHGYAGNSIDAMSEDDINDFLVLGIDIVNACPPPIIPNDPITLPISFTINAASTYPQASGVVITAPVPAGTVYSGCAMGSLSGSCAESGGLVTWTLANTVTPGTGDTVSFIVTENAYNSIDTYAYISIAEGLSDQAAATGCSAATPTPTATTPPEPTPNQPDDDDDQQAPAPTPTWTATAMLQPTLTPTPNFPTRLPETGGNDGLPAIFTIALVIAGLGTLLIGYRKLKQTGTDQ